MLDRRPGPGSRQGTGRLGDAGQVTRPRKQAGDWKAGGCWASNQGSRQGPGRLGEAGLIFATRWRERP